MENMHFHQPLTVDDGIRVEKWKIRLISPGWRWCILPKRFIRDFRERGSLRVPRTACPALIAKSRARADKPPMAPPSRRNRINQKNVCRCSFESNGTRWTLLAGDNGPSRYSAAVVVSDSRAFFCDSNHWCSGRARVASIWSMTAWASAVLPSAAASSAMWRAWGISSL